MRSLIEKRFRISLERSHSLRASTANSGERTKRRRHTSITLLHSFPFSQLRPEFSDPDVLCAALLHDTIEDTETSVEELVETFGGHVASLVQEVTDDKRLPKS